MAAPDRSPIPEDPGRRPGPGLSATVLERCWQIIKDMPDRQHAVAVLRWQEAMKEGEIAAVLRMAENTVNAHVHRARRTLIAQLGPDYPFDNDAEGAPS
jgi:RNA polymerase sigma-70 factor, ECF subfamily